MEAAAGECCERLGARHVLVVTDRGVMEAGWTEPVLESCREAGLTAALFDQVSVNPTDDEADACARVYKKMAAMRLFPSAAAAPSISGKQPLRL